MSNNKLINFSKELIIPISSRIEELELLALKLKELRKLYPDLVFFKEFEQATTQFLMSEQLNTDPDLEIEFYDNQLSGSQVNIIFYLKKKIEIAVNNGGLIDLCFQQAIYTNPMKFTPVKYVVYSNQYQIVNYEKYLQSLKIDQNIINNIHLKLAEVIAKSKLETERFDLSICPAKLKTLLAFS